MELLGRPLILRPAPYTSQSDSRNGILGKRDGHNFVGFDGWQANADWNAARTIAKWDGFACPLGLYVSQDGAFEDPQDFGSPSASGCAEMQMGNGREYAADSLCCGLETGIPVSLDRGASTYTPPGCPLNRSKTRLVRRRDTRFVKITATYSKGSRTKFKHCSSMKFIHFLIKIGTAIISTIVQLKRSRFEACIPPIAKQEPN